MHVLIADDDPVLRHALKAHLLRWKYDVVECGDGGQAWHALQSSAPPPIAIVDWEMPGLDGPTLCEKLRGTPSLATTYVILLTGKENRKDVISGLESGVDDYIKKPFDWDELRARLQIGSRTVNLQHTLASRVAELQDALAKVRKLSGLLPICAYCKSIRNDQDYWQQIETFVGQHSDAQFSHGICPQCMATHHPTV
jgi:sigma-B regulation protein RsbU (phosphoserine phosphatase)